MTISNNGDDSGIGNGNVKEYNSNDVDNDISNSGIVGGNCCIDD